MPLVEIAAIRGLSPAATPADFWEDWHRQPCGVGVWDTRRHQPWRRVRGPRRRTRILAERVRGEG